MKNSKQAFLVGLLTLLAAREARAFAHTTVAQDRVAGRVVDAEGRPATGAEVRLDVPGGAGTGWIPIELDGTFVVGDPARATVPRVFQARRDSDVPVERELPPGGVGGVLQLGEIVLRPAGVLTGFLEDSDGSLLVDGWPVQLTTGGRTYRSSPVAPDPVTGLFTISGLSPLTYEIHAAGPVGSLRGPDVTLGEGERAHVQVRNPGPALGRRLEVQLDTTPYAPSLGGVGVRFALEDEAGAVVARSRASSSGLIVVEDLEPAPYTFVVDDPRWESKRVPGLFPATRHPVALRGSAALALVVRDGKRRPLGRFAAKLIEVEDEERGRAFSIHPIEEWAPRGGRIEGVPPGDWVAQVTDLEGRRVELEVTGLRPGDERSLEVSFPPIGDLVGIVRTGDGAPAAHARVEYTRGPMPGVRGSGGAITVRLSGGEERKLPSITGEVDCDADGRFAIRDLRHGWWTLHAFMGDYAATVETVDLGEDEVEVPLALPVTARVEGRVLLAAPEQAERIKLYCVENPSAPTVLDVLRSAAGRGIVRPAPDGSFAIDSVPAGTIEVRSMLDSPRLAFARLQGAPAAGSGFRTGPGPRTVVHVGARDAGPLLLDARGAFAASLLVRLESNGAARPDLDALLLWPFSHEDRVTWTGTRMPAPLRDDRAPGAFAFEEIDPGPYRLEIIGPSRQWRWRPTRTFEVASGLLTDELVSVPLARETLVLRDAEGILLAGVPVVLERADMSFVPRANRTDERGRLDLELPGEGALTLSVRRLDGALQATLAWPPAPGDHDLNLVKLP